MDFPDVIKSINFSDVIQSINLQTALRASLTLFAAYVVGTISYALYGAFLGPLSKFPGPKLYAFTRIPKAWNTLQGRSHKFITGLHEQYGDVVRVAPNELSFRGSAQIWNDIYGFKKPGVARPRKDPKTYRKDLNGSHSIISAPDADHSRMRKILSHAFSDRALREQEYILKHWVGKLVSKLSEVVEDGKAVDMLKYYNCTTFDVMGDLTFSENLHMLDKGELNPWVETIFASIKVGVRLANIAAFHPILQWMIMNVFNSRYVRKKAWEHWSYTRDRLDRRLAMPEEANQKPDFWSKILAKGGDVDGGLSLGEHHANASIFMMAGTETTATALSGTTFHLLRNPEYLQRLKDEIRGAFNSLEDLSLPKLAQLKYLQACLSEGLRMYPPVPGSAVRQSPLEGGCIIGGQHVAAGVTVGVHVVATHLSEDNFANPTEFHPQRWLGEEERFKNDNLDSMEVFAYGPRNCLGKNLAWHEMRLILTSVLLNYDLELDKGMETWDQQKIYALWEKVPLMCTITRP